MDVVADFMGSDSVGCKPVKLVDVIKDPDEKIDLMGNPEYKGVFVRLSAVIESFPMRYKCSEEK